MNCEELISSYLATLQGGFSCLPSAKERVRVVTPYLYPDHDRIELFVRERGDKVTVSDLGETLRHLETLGMDVISNQKRWFQVQHIAAGLQVQVREGVILKEAAKESVGETIFDVLAACKAVADLIYSTRAYEPATFEDEVAEYLEESELKAERRVPVVGESGTKYTVNLQVPAGQKTALIATLSPKSSAGVRGQVNAVFRMWSDINHGAWKFSLLNDEMFVFRQEDLLLLQRVSALHRWTARQEFLAALKAEERKH
jgi:hypothetical protein